MDRNAEGGPEKQAQALLLKYSGQRIRGANRWKEWYEKNKSGLEFSDGRGYKFQKTNLITNQR